MEEQNAEREKVGIKSPDQISAEQRKEIMAEKSNIGEESKRQMYLRMAEFFSNWGSTPGLPLVAGLKAMKDTIPGVMSDSKEDHAAYAAVNKSLRDLEHATELEKAGHFDKAYAIKEQASATVLKHKEKVADWAHEQWKVSEQINAQKQIAGMAQEGENVRSLLSYNKPRAGTSPELISERGRGNDLKNLQAKLKHLDEQLAGTLVMTNGKAKDDEIAQIKLDMKQTINEMDNLRNKSYSQPKSGSTSSTKHDFSAADEIIKRK